MTMQCFLSRGRDALKCFAGKYECASHTVQTANALCPQDTCTFQRGVLTRRANVSFLASLLILWGTTTFITGAQAQQNNPPDPDLQKQDVPHGKTAGFVFKNSRVYPGTEHNVTVYVPAQYDGSKPACVMIFQDGLGFNAPTVFDNLIAKKQMPVCVAIGINPGVSPPARPGALPRYNRSVEYDTPDGTYARFLLEEILPEVGKTLKLSSNPDDRGLVGGSSGGIAAFTAAWERPDQFRRVYSVVGSFTDLAGGDTYPSKIRKSEPKPLRIYLQDNDHDQDIYSGSWPLSNTEVAAALKYAGYDHQYTVGQGGHDGGPGSRIFPEVLRWLWRDYPAPLKANMQTGQPIAQILSPGEDWKPLAVESENGGGITSGAQGNVYVMTPANTGLMIVSEQGVQNAPLLNFHHLGPLSFRPNGHLLAYQADRKRLIDLDDKGKETLVAANINVASLVTSQKGIIYYQDERDGSIWQIAGKSKPRKAAVNLSAGQCLTLTPDQSLLIADGGGPRKTLMSWRVQSDGTLTDGQPFFDLTIPYNQTGAQATVLVTDTNGWLYAATPAGIQICDQAGRVNGIIALPERTTSITAMAWGGTNHDILYVTCNGKLYRRKLRVKGVLPFEAPITPPGPRL